MHTYRETERQAYTHRDIYIYRDRHTYGDREADTETGPHIQIHRGIYRNIHRNGAYTDTVAETAQEGDIHRGTVGQTDKEAETETEAEAKAEADT